MERSNINNLILKKVAAALCLHHEDVHELIRVGGEECTTSKVRSVFCSPDNRRYSRATSEMVSGLIRGLAIQKGSLYLAGSRDALDCNGILKGIKSALRMRREDLGTVFSYAGVQCTNSKLKGLLSSPRNSNYRPCSHGLLLRFLDGLVVAMRNEDRETDANHWEAA